MGLNPAEKYRRQQKEKQKAANKARRQEHRQARAYLADPDALEKEVAELHAKDQSTKRGLQEKDRIKLDVLQGQVDAVKR